MHSLYSSNATHRRITITFGGDVTPRRLEQELLELRELYEMHRDWDGILDLRTVRTWPSRSELRHLCLNLPRITPPKGKLPLRVLVVSEGFAGQLAESMDLVCECFGGGAIAEFKVAQTIDEATAALDAREPEQ